MNPFEALVVSEHDTDKKFIDASSFFVSLKEPVEKTAAKAAVMTKVKQKALKSNTKLSLPKKEITATEVRALAREMVKNKTKTTKLPTEAKVTPIKDLKPGEIKKLKSGKVVLSSARSSALVARLQKEARLKPGVMDYITSLPSAAKKIVNPEGLKGQGMKAAFMPDAPTPGLKDRVLGKLESLGGPFSPKGMFGKETRRLKEINKIRETKGLPPMRNLADAEEFMSGFGTASNLSEFLQVPALRKMFTNAATGKLDPLQGASQLGVTAPDLISAGRNVMRRASEGRAAGIASQGTSMMDRYGKYALPAAGAAGAAGLGYYGYKKYKDSKNPYQNQGQTGMLFQG